MSRKTFREAVFDRDGYTCNIPWCSRDAVDAHHIWERGLWDDGGYVPENGSSVCEDHHKMSERNEIPPQAHLRWCGIKPEDITLPDNVRFSSDKWGEPFETPPHSDLRDYHKYPSTRHLLPLYWQSSRGTAEQRTGRDDTGLRSVESLLNIPLVVTVKMDGSNAMLVADADEPVRARNGRDADHESFDQLKQAYWDRNVYSNLPDHLQVFGENMYAKHSIHYGCDGCCDERNQGPPVDDLFLVFGVYDTRYDLWLSWPETEDIADQIGFETAPVAWTLPNDDPTTAIDSYSNEQHFIDDVLAGAEKCVDNGHEGIIVRSMYPFHWAQFEEKVGKFVRCNHVQTDEHWSHQRTTRNKIERIK